MLKLQTDGFIENGKVRKIPFEIKVIGDKAPIYGETLEDLGRFNEDPQLPFNAYGTLALARQEFEANSGSSQVFWLLKVRKSCQCPGPFRDMQRQTPRKQDRFWTSMLAILTARHSYGFQGPLLGAVHGQSPHALSVVQAHSSWGGLARTIICKLRLVCLSPSGVASCSSRLPV